MNDLAASVMDSRLLRDMFASAGMRDVFSDAATLGGWLRAEAALAQAEADCGLIERNAADKISRMARAECFDLEELRAGMTATGHPLVAIIDALAATCGDAGKYVHYGATTQDIIDTGMILQVREGLERITRNLQLMIEKTAMQAEHYKHAVMAARTHGQQAVPTTLGFKFALLASELCRHRTRMEQMRPRLLCVSLSGAAGTLATLGRKGAEVRAAMARQLDLNLPDASWHTDRDSLAECVSVLAMTAQTCAKFANEVINLQRTEIGELAEPSGEGAVGSSTMPQKRNPMTSQQIVALARLVRRQPGAMLEAMQHEHERDFSVWTTEWAIVPETFIMTDWILEASAHVMGGLVVNRQQMTGNLERAGGFANAEAVMMRLAPAIGRDEAHHLVAGIVRRAVLNERPLVDVLIEDATVGEHLSIDDIQEVLAPENWIGEAVRETDRILEKL